MYCDLWLQYIQVRKLFKGGNYSRAETLMDVIDHSIPKCTDPIEKDEYCMLGLNGFGISQELKSHNIKQCKFKGSTRVSRDKVSV